VSEHAGEVLREDVPEGDRRPGAAVRRAVGAIFYFTSGMVTAVDEFFAAVSNETHI
jgi:hypothetical protein